ncbi:MAG: TonB C-terminal domain-containing protein [Proteobacteria bacterium]|nr:TonB C-terminal domain-containing protein [Pseudomonadota bacterium]
MAQYLSRPPGGTSVLRSPRLDAPMFIGGLLATACAHVALPVALPLLQGLGLFSEGTEAFQIEEKQIVEARFVQLGKPFDPRKMPNRQVPRLTTAPDDKTVVSRKLKPEKKKRRKQKRPEQPVEDLLTQLGDRAKAFAEIAEVRDKEGDAEGVAEGTQKQAKAGNVYAGKLYGFFKKGWTVPETMSRDELQGLATGVLVSITTDAKIGKFAIKKSSGNPLFDQSVLDRLEALRKADATLPEPPPEVSNQYLGQTIRLNFKGRDAG